VIPIRNFLGGFFLSIAPVFSNPNKKSIPYYYNHFGMTTSSFQVDLKQLSIQAVGKIVATTT